MNAVKVSCPKCKGEFRAKSDTGHDDAPMAVCPGCGHVFFIKEPPPLDVELPEEEEREPDFIPDIYLRRIKQSKRYLALILVLLAVVLGYQFSEMLRRESVLSEAHNRSAKAVLKSLVLAQEAYYIEANTYASRLSDLKDLFTGHPSVEARIDRAGPSSWAGAAWYKGESAGVQFISDQGGFQLDPLAVAAPPE